MSREWIKFCVKTQGILGPRQRTKRRMVKCCVQWKHGAYDRRLTRSQGFIWKFWKGGLYGMKAQHCEDWERPVGSDGDVIVYGGQRGT